MSGTQLPPSLKERLNGQLGERAIVGWAQYDLNDENQFASQFAVLTDTELFQVGVGEVRSFPLKQIEEASIVEGLGVDRLRIRADGKLAIEMRYSRSYRRDMTRLHRKLSRRIPSSSDKPEQMTPEWLESVEQRAELQENCPRCGNAIPAWSEGVCPRCLQQRKILWRLLDIAKPYRKQIWIALALTMVVSLLGAAMPAFSKYLIDSALIPRNMNHLLWWGGSFVVMIALTEAMGGIRMYILARLGTKLTGDLRHMVYAHLHELSLRYFAKRRTGSLITRVTSDTDRLWDFIAFGSINLIRDVAMIGFIAILMFYFNWALALIALLPLPILAIMTYLRAMKMQRMFGRLWTYWSRVTAVVGDALPGVRVVKAFANEQKEIDRFDRRSDEYTEKEQEIHKIWTVLSPMISGLMRLGALMVWVIGGVMIIKWPEETDASGKVIAHAGNTLGVLMALTQCLGQFYQPIMELANSSRMITRAASSAQRVFEVLDTAPEIYSRSGAITNGAISGNIEFRNVSFSYEGAQPALRGVSFTVQAGEMIGLCGPSGAGKSTLVNLLCRFYEVTDGQILIDGTDIRDFDLKWLRKQVGMVLQEPYLFHGTITDNIRYGDPNASQADVIRAAWAANAHDFIVGFPDGYDTMVGERGQSLSGGERQRISIARAILHQPRLLILDEATSSVDTETEKQIQQALDRLVEGRTTFAIAHRLSTLQAADRLIVLQEGKIAEEGTHATLVDKPDGVYAKLHRTQVEMNAQVAIR